MLHFCVRCAKISTMKEHKTFPGAEYVVTCRNGCTLTDANGMSLTVAAGKQERFWAQSSVVYTSEAATVTRIVK